MISNDILLSHFIVHTHTLTRFFYNVLFFTYVLLFTYCQAQMRDLAGFVETRQQLLTLKSNHRMNWIGFAVAHHLNSKYDFH